VILRLPASRSSISLKVSFSRSFMLICIHQQLPLFRLIPHWNHFAVSGSLRIGITQILQAHSALDNSGA
jgi:hypothetical protein